MKKWNVGVVCEEVVYVEKWNVGGMCEEVECRWNVWRSGTYDIRSTYTSYVKCGKEDSWPHSLVDIYIVIIGIPAISGHIHLTGNKTIYSRCIWELNIFRIRYRYTLPYKV